VRAALSEFFELSAQAVLLLNPGALSRTTSGKISRVACREQYLAGDFRPIASEDAQSVAALASDTPINGLAGCLFQRVASVLRVPVDALDGEQTLGELGLDSLKRVELAITLEQLSERSLGPELFEPDLRLIDLLRLLQGATTVSKSDDVAVKCEAFDTPGRELPLTPLQHAFLYVGVEKPETFLEIVYLRTPRDLDAEALRAGSYPIWKTVTMPCGCAFTLMARTGGKPMACPEPVWRSSVSMRPGYLRPRCGSAARPWCSA